jgi:hypothetical protein
MYPTTKSKLAGGLLAAAFVFGATTASAQSPILKADVPGPGSVNNTVFIVLAKI